jgi:hypothetical protein
MLKNFMRHIMGLILTLGEAHISGWVRRPAASRKKNFAGGSPQIKPAHIQRRKAGINATAHATSSNCHSRLRFTRPHRFRNTAVRATSAAGLGW